MPKSPNISFEIWPENLFLWKNKWKIKTKTKFSVNGNQEEITLPNTMFYKPINSIVLKNRQTHPNKPRNRYIVCEELINALKRNLKNQVVSFLRPNMWTANKHMKRWSISLVIRQTQIKTTVRYQLHTPKGFRSCVRGTQNSGRRPRPNMCTAGFFGEDNAGEDGRQKEKRKVKNEMI